MSDGPIEFADIDWTTNDVPFSRRFRDVYFSSDDGLGESRHVFLAGNSLPDAWRSRRIFSICETGFGTGLNFLAAWDLWRGSKPDGGHLHFVSVERYPLRRVDIARALARWPSLNELSARLVSVYPDPATGFHRLLVADDVTLTLILMDAAPGLSALEATIDAWFLDGFAPATNSDMWRKPVLDNLSRLSRPGATFATFTVAGLVRRQLTQLGFEVEKRPGFGRKREMLCGTFRGTRRSTLQQPWYCSAPVSHKRRALIIGAGIAGVSSAAALMRRGWRVTLVDRGGAIASGASGNPRAVLAPRVAVDPTPRDLFYPAAFRFAAGFVRATDAPGLDATGVLSLATTPQETARQERVAAHALLPKSLVQHVDARTASEIAGLKLSCPALYFPGLGSLRTRDHCEWLAQACEVLFNRDVTALAHDGEEWVLRTRSGELVAKAPTVIVANGIGALEFSYCSFLPLQAFEGQVGRVEPTPASEDLRCVLNFSHYITPAHDGLHTIGASYRPVDPQQHRHSSDWSANDHARIVKGLQRISRQGFSFGAPPADARWTGLRCTTPDRHPVVGPLPDFGAYCKDYKGLIHGQKGDYPAARYHTGLYVHLALGSQGFLSAPLAAELLASQICGEPWPVERRVADSLHPARFIVRGLKRGSIDPDARTCTASHKG